MHQFIVVILFTKSSFVFVVQVVKMEADILKSLNFEMGNPTIKTFLRQEDHQHAIFLVGYH